MLYKRQLMFSFYMYVCQDQCLYRSVCPAAWTYSIYLVLLCTSLVCLSLTLTLFLSVSVCLLVCMSLSLFLSLSVSLIRSLSHCVSVCLSVRVSVCLTLHCNFSGLSDRSRKNTSNVLHMCL